jgi:hypothetical protein
LLKSYDIGLALPRRLPERRQNRLRSRRVVELKLNWLLRRRSGFPVNGIWGMEAKRDWGDVARQRYGNLDGGIDAAGFALFHFSPTE